jgi:hypothetical protein
VTLADSALASPDANTVTFPSDTAHLKAGVLSDVGWQRSAASLWALTDGTNAILKLGAAPSAYSVAAMAGVVVVARARDAGAVAGGAGLAGGGYAITAGAGSAAFAGSGAAGGAGGSVTLQAAAGGAGDGTGAAGLPGAVRANGAILASDLAATGDGLLKGLDAPSDTLTRNIQVRGGDAYPIAFANVRGGYAVESTGAAAMSFTVVANTGLAGTKQYIRVPWTAEGAVYVTAGTDYALGTDDTVPQLEVTATNLAAALGVFAAYITTIVAGPTVYVSPVTLGTNPLTATYTFIHTNAPLTSMTCHSGQTAVSLLGGLDVYHGHMLNQFVFASDDAKNGTGGMTGLQYEFQMYNMSPVTLHPVFGLSWRSYHYGGGNITDAYWHDFGGGAAGGVRGGASALAHVTTSHLLQAQDYHYAAGVDTAYGIYHKVWLSGTYTSANTGTSYSFIADAPAIGGAFTIVNDVHFMSVGFNASTTNQAHILLGTASVPTGKWAAYSVDTNASYWAGNQNLKSTASVNWYVTDPSGALDLGLKRVSPGLMGVTNGGAGVGNASLGYARLANANTNTYWEMADGQNVPVSNANEARIRYNNAKNLFETSINGGAYTIPGVKVFQYVVQANAFAAGDVVRIDGTGTWVKSQADTAANAEVAGVVETASGTVFTVVMEGYITGLAGLTAGATYFLSAVTPGLLTATDPNIANAALVSKPVLDAADANTGYVLSLRGIYADTTAGVFPEVTKSADYPATLQDWTIFVDATAAPVTITLPSAATAGKTFNVKKIDVTANAVAVATTGGQTIDGLPGFATVTPYESIMVQSDGSNWFSI